MNSLKALRLIRTVRSLRKARKERSASQSFTVVFETFISWATSSTVRKAFSSSGVLIGVQSFDDFLVDDSEDFQEGESVCRTVDQVRCVVGCVG